MSGGISLYLPYIAEKILEKRTENKQTKYLIKWRGRGDEQNTWESLKCNDFIEYVLETGGFNTKPFTKRNEHCWDCRQPGTQIDCPACNRSFHGQCSKTTNLSPDQLFDWQCIICNDIAQGEIENKSRNVDIKKLNRLLNYVLVRVSDDDTFQLVRFPLFKLQKRAQTTIIVHPFNLQSIQHKVNQEAYKSYADFFGDLQRIYHNCCVYYSDIEELPKAVNKLLRFCRSEIESAEICTECYINANEEPDIGFELPCAKPHLIIWAKMKQYPYWPAKVMTIEGDNKVNVRFFGDHTHGKVPVSNCFMYSREYPNGGEATGSVIRAIDEAGKYIRNVFKKFGEFNYALLDTPLTITNGSLKHHFLHQIPATKNLFDENAGHGAMTPKKLSTRRKSVFTIELRRKNVAGEPGPSKIMTRRTTLRSNGLVKEEKPKPNVLNAQRAKQMVSLQKRLAPLKIEPAKLNGNPNRKRPATLELFQTEFKRVKPTEPFKMAPLAKRPIALPPNGNGQSKPDAFSQLRLQTTADNAKRRPVQDIKPSLPVKMPLDEQFQKLCKSFVQRRVQSLHMDFGQLIKQVQELLKPKNDVKILEEKLKAMEKAHQQKINGFRDAYLRRIKELHLKHSNNIEVMKKHMCSGCCSKFTK